MKLSILILVIFCSRGNCIFQRFYEQREISILMCQGIQDEMPKLLGELNDASVTDMDLIDEQGQSSGSLLTSTSLQASHQFTSASLASDLCDSVLTIYQNTITQFRLIEECATKDNFVNPFSIIGGGDQYLLGYNLLSKMYVHTVHDLQKMMQAHSLIYELFKDDAEAMRKPLQSKISLLYPLVSLMDKHHSQYLAYKESCHTKAKELSRVKYISQFA